MGLLPDIGYPQTGDTVERGMYCCMNCDYEAENQEGLIIINKKQKLPECPLCGITYWMPI